MSKRAVAASASHHPSMLRSAHAAKEEGHYELSAESQSTHVAGSDTLDGPPRAQTASQGHSLDDAASSLASSACLSRTILARGHARDDDGDDDGDFARVKPARHWSAQSPKDALPSVGAVHIQLVELPEKFVAMVSKHARFEEIRRISRRRRSSRSFSPSLDRAAGTLPRAMSVHERVGVDNGPHFHEELDVGIASFESHAISSSTRGTDKVGQASAINVLSDKLKTMRTSTV